MSEWDRPGRDISYRTRSRSPSRPRSRTPPRNHRKDKNPIDWTCRDVHDWLKDDQDFERYASDFELEGIDGVELEKLTPQDLSDTLGVKKRHRPQLIMTIRQLFSRLKNHDSQPMSNSSGDFDDDDEFPCTYEVISGKGVRVRETQDIDSASLGKIWEGTLVVGVAREGRRLKIRDPISGWVSIKNSAGREMLRRESETRRGSDEAKIEESSPRRGRDRPDVATDEPRGKWNEKLKYAYDSLRKQRGDDDSSYQREEGPRDEVSDLKKKLRRVKEMGRQEKAVLLEQANLSENELHHLTNKLELTSEDVEVLKDKMQRLKDKIRGKDEEMESLREELRRSKEKRHNDEIDEIREELRQVQKERDELADNHTDLTEDHRDQKARLKEVKEDLETVTKELEKYKGRRNAGDSEYKYMEEEDENVGRVPRTRRRLSSDEEDNYQTPDSPGAPKARRSNRHNRRYRTRGNDNYVETGVDEDYDDREDSYKCPSRMKSSSPEFDDSWPSAKNSPRHSRLSDVRSRYDDDEDMNDDERRARRRGREDFGWFIRYDGKGKPYYYNSVTRSKRKDKPGTLDSMGSVKIHDPVILCEYDGIWYKAQLIAPHKDERWWVLFDCGRKKKESIHRDHIRKWVAWLEEAV